MLSHLFSIHNLVLSGPRKTQDETCSHSIIHSNCLYLKIPKNCNGLIKLITLWQASLHSPTPSPSFHLRSLVTMTSCWYGCRKEVGAPAGEKEENGSWRNLNSPCGRWSTNLESFGLHKMGLWEGVGINLSSGGEGWVFTWQNSPPESNNQGATFQRKDIHVDTSCYLKSHPPHKRAAQSHPHASVNGSPLTVHAHMMDDLAGACYCHYIEFLSSSRCSCSSVLLRGYCSHDHLLYRKCLTGLPVPASEHSGPFLVFVKSFILGYLDRKSVV